MPLLIAVDLGSHAVKVETWRTSGRRVELEGRFSYPVPQGGSAPPLASRLAALEALIDENPAWANGSATIGLVLPGQDVAFRPMSMPFTDRAQVEKTLPFAIEGEVPYDLAEMALGWRVTRLDDASRVMAVLARKDVLRGYLEALAGRGMDPRDVVADGELLGAYGVPGETVAVLDIGHTHTVVSVVVDREVRASRVINVGGWNFTRAIQDALQVEWSAAEAMKHGQTAGVAEDEEVTDPGRGGKRSGYAALPPAARQAVDAAIGQLLAEVRSTLIRFEDTLKLDVTGIQVCGGSARIPELRAYLAQDLGLPVSGAADAEGVGVPGPFGAAHAMGRSLAGLAAERPVDLRVGDLAFRGGVNTLRAVLTYGAAGAAFFAVAAVVIFTVQYVSLLREASEVNARIASIVVETFPEVPASQVDGGHKALAIMTEFTADTVKRSASLPPAEPGIPPTVDTLYALTGALPAHDQVPIELSSLDVLPELIVFEGETSGFAQSAQIEEALKADARFSTGNKDSESRTSDGKVKFKFSIPLKADEEAG